VVIVEAIAEEVIVAVIAQEVTVAVDTIAIVHQSQDPTVDGVKSRVIVV